MDKSQEPKYDAIDGKIVNRATGEAIPDDEPVFIIRARDDKAIQTLKHYKYIVHNDEHRQAVNSRICDFVFFKAQNPDRMKEPDTSQPEGEQ